MNTIDAHAKINLALRITGRDGGFHTLDMVTASLALADCISLVGVAKKSTVQYARGTAFIPDRSDNCLAAIEGMARFVGETGFHVQITKNIPSRAGLGGSSAEAAGVIRLLSTCYGLDIESADIQQLARSIGSDVPVLLRTGYHRVTGCGERVQPLLCIRRYAVLIACSGSVSTAEAFGLSDECAPLKGDNVDLIHNLNHIEPYMLVNDLTVAAIQLEPRIESVLSDMRRLGALGCNMTGSGAACFALFDTVAEACIAGERIHADYIIVTEIIV